jgi:hypothetical protein
VSRDPRIKVFQCGQSPGLHDPVVAAAQLRPSKSPYGAQGCPPSHCPHGRQEGSPIRCELCLDQFGFSSHDAPWCPFLHPDNIKDREIKKWVLQYKVTHSIKQDSVPDQLKQAIKDIPTPHKACLPEPVVHFAEADAMPYDEDSGSGDENTEDTETTLVDSAQLDYLLPPMANSAMAASQESGEINCPFDYRALQG